MGRLSCRDWFHVRLPLQVAPQTLLWLVLGLDGLGAEVRWVARRENLLAESSQSPPKSKQ